MEDEIVILVDTPKCPPELNDFLKEYSNHKLIKVFYSEFKGNFADWKNELTSKCRGEWIFNIDADEIPHGDLIKSIHEIIEFNPEIESYWVPRINTLIGDSDQIKQYVASQGWMMNEKGWINFPDNQLRIYKNHPDIKWVNKVHETVRGATSVSMFPQEETFCLYHPKSLEKQVKQNQFYNNL